MSGVKGAMHSTAVRVRPRRPKRKGAAGVEAAENAGERNGSSVIGGTFGCGLRVHQRTAGALSIVHLIVDVVLSGDRVDLDRIEPAIGENGGAGFDQVFQVVLPATGEEICRTRGGGVDPQRRA